MPTGTTPRPARMADHHAHHDYTLNDWIAGLLGLGDGDDGKPGKHGHRGKGEDPTPPPHDSHA